jgi:hypothetical protein
MKRIMAIAVCVGMLWTPSRAAKYEWVLSQPKQTQQVYEWVLGVPAVTIDGAMGGQVIFIQMD